MPFYCRRLVLVPQGVPSRSPFPNSVENQICSWLPPRITWKPPQYARNGANTVKMRRLDLGLPDSICRPSAIAASPSHDPIRTPGRTQVHPHIAVAHGLVTPG